MPKQYNRLLCVKPAVCWFIMTRTRIGENKQSNIKYRNFALKYVSLWAFSELDCVCVQMYVVYDFVSALWSWTTRWIFFLLLHAISFSANWSISSALIIFIFRLHNSFGKKVSWNISVYYLIYKYKLMRNVCYRCAKWIFTDTKHNARTHTHVKRIDCCVYAYHSSPHFVIIIIIR